MQKPMSKFDNPMNKGRKMPPMTAKKKSAKGPKAPSKPAKRKYL